MTCNTMAKIGTNTNINVVKKSESYQAYITSSYKTIEIILKYPIPHGFYMPRVCTVTIYTVFKHPVSRPCSSYRVASFKHPVAQACTRYKTAPKPKHIFLNTLNLHSTARGMLYLLNTLYSTKSVMRLEKKCNIKNVL